MTCPTEGELRAFQLGDLPVASLDQVADHLEHCPRCERLAEQFDTALDPILATLRNSAVRAMPHPTRRMGSADTPPIQGDTPISAAAGGFPFLLPAVQPDEIGRLGNYRVLRLLGKGGMAFVFQAEDIALRRPVALKVMKPELSKDGEGWQRFLREARIMASIKHEHLVTVFQVGQEGPTTYLAMELLHGESLGVRMDRQLPTDLAEILRLAREMASGLAVVHRHGLVHRDVKPDNIWLETPGDRVKILDFGLARLQNDDVRLTQMGMIMGTPSYMAPEQARGETVDARSDLFSLGCILYALCTGTRPFQANNTLAVLTALAVEMPPPVQEQNAFLPPALSALVMQLLAKDPSQRPSSAQEVVERIQAIEQGLSESTGAQTGSPRRKVTSVMAVERKGFPATWRRWRWIAVAGVAAAGFGLVCLAIWGGRTDEGSHATPLATPNGKKLPVKVFLLAGQNDMGGKGALRTLNWLSQDAKDGALLQKLKDADGGWRTRRDVWIYYDRDTSIKKGNLTVGFGQTDDEIGPELLFGHVLGDYLENPVLLIKVTQGPMSLASEALSPTSGGPGPFYQRMINLTRKVRDYLDVYFPELEGRGYELAGFVWFQGWNDMIKPDRLTQYGPNLVNLIKDVRRDLGAPNLPVVIGEMGVNGAKPTEAIVALRQAQAAVVKRAEFRGTVALAETSGYWDDEADALFRKGWSFGQWHDKELHAQFEKMGSQPEYLYLGSGKIFARIGQGFGETMKQLIR